MSVGSIIFFPQVSARLRRTRRCCESACTRSVVVNNISVPHARSGVFAALSLSCAVAQVGYRDCVASHRIRWRARVAEEWDKLAGRWDME